MAIDIIAPRIDALVPTMQSLFTTHDLVGIIILNHREEWDRLVTSYRGTIERQEQKSVQQIGRYLGRNADRLRITQGRTIPDSRIEGLDHHTPRETTEWIPH